MFTFGAALRGDFVGSLGEGEWVELGSPVFTWGPPGAGTSRLADALRIELTGRGVQTLRIKLGDGIEPSEAMPTAPMEVVITGHLSVSCSAPGANKSPTVLQDDPGLQTEFCRSAIDQLGLEKLFQ
ncbi:MAG: hypothetical protein FJ104_08110 [Deltaproteobacteria bacterium]|nr:hypothetical protein [Deltaproteobacteria bacterium]